MGSFAGKFAVVTGASSGIGRAIALSLAERGTALCLVGRRLGTLAAVARAASQSAEVAIRMADIADDDDLGRLAGELRAEHERIDLLVHAAGVIALGCLAEASIDDLDRQYRVNVRAPYALTQALLPQLVAARGQIVFVNSSAGLIAGAGVGQYAATKHALKAIADSLRDEINRDGVRVLSVYPGRTASPMQEAIHRTEGKHYRPNCLLQPEAIAATVVGALDLPRTAEITDIRIRPERGPLS